MWLAMPLRESPLDEQIVPYHYSTMFFALFVFLTGPDMEVWFELPSLTRLLLLLDGFQDTYRLLQINVLHSTVTSWVDSQ